MGEIGVHMGRLFILLKLLAAPEEAGEFLRASETSLRPFAITPNKLYLARPAAHSLYLSALSRTQGGYFEKTSCMFGRPVSIFGVEPQTWTPSARLKRWLKQSAAGPPLMRTRHLLTRTAGQ